MTAVWNYGRPSTKIQVPNKEGVYVGRYLQQALLPIGVWCVYYIHVINLLFLLYKIESRPLDSRGLCLTIRFANWKFDERLRGLSLGSWKGKNLYFILTTRLPCCTVLR